LGVFEKALGEKKVIWRGDSLRKFDRWTGQIKDKNGFVIHMGTFENEQYNGPGMGFRRNGDCRK
jgi:hypothetical protein